MFQVVQGFAETGRLLTRHPGIRKVSLTGEVGTGKAVMARCRADAEERDARARRQVAADHLRGCQARQRGRPARLLGNFYSSGQVCSNGTRVFVHASIKAAFLERLLERVSAMRIGDPMDPRDPSGRADIGAAHAARCSATSRAAAPRARGSSIGGDRVTDGELAQGLLRRAHGIR